MQLDAFAHPDQPMAGPADGGGYVVRARLPIQEAAT